MAVNDTITQIHDGEPVIYVELSGILEGNGYSKPDINHLLSEFISEHCAALYSHLDVVKHEPSWLLQPYSFTGSIDKNIVETKPHILFMKELSSDDFQLIVPLYSSYYWSAIMRLFQAIKHHLGGDKHKLCINELIKFMNKIHDYYKISDPNRMNDDEKNQIFVQLNKFWKRNADNFASAIKSVALTSNNKGVGHE